MKVLKSLYKNRQTIIYKLKNKEGKIKYEKKELIRITDGF